MKDTSRIRVIIVTDGDKSAQRAVETASLRLGLYPLMITGGNPTRISAAEALEHIIKAPYDPVVVMADDKGKIGMGPGEYLMEALIKDPRLLVMGIVAVASDTKVRGVVVDKAVTAGRRIIEEPVNKHGNREKSGHHRLEGDTVEILSRHPELFIVGCGDLGKMNGKDSAEHGAAVTAQCFREIMNHYQTLEK